MKMTQTFIKMNNLMKMRRFMRTIYNGIVKSATSNSASQFEYHQDRAIAAPCISTSVPSASIHGYKRWKLDAPFPTSSVNILPAISMRHYSTKKNDDNFPRLTSMKGRGYPAGLSTFSNFFLTYLVIKPNLDQSFSTDEFLLTSKKVVEMVSNRIANSDLEALKDLVTSDVLEEIKTNLPKFSVSQRQDLAATDEELMYSFLDTISLNVDNENNTKSLEILTIHHVLKGIEEVKKIAENFNPFDTKTIEKKILPRSFVMNYRFFRKFHSSGEADDWIINGVQHIPGKSVKFGNFF